MRPVVGVGRACVVFQQQRQVEITGLESFGNKIPVLNHGLHKPLYILLRSEALCVSHLTTAPYLRQKFAWWIVLGPHISAAMNPSSASKFMARSLRNRPRASVRSSSSASVSFGVLTPRSCCPTALSI